MCPATAPRTAGTPGATSAADANAQTMPSSRVIQRSTAVLNAARGCDTFASTMMGTVKPISENPYESCPRSTVQNSVEPPSHRASAMSTASVSCANQSTSTSEATAPTMLPSQRQDAFCSELARVASDTDSTVQSAHSGCCSSNSIAR